ncbi:centrosomal protein of 44 kDa isoform X3 [Dipodomys merriami]|uniref:centrosomal protein of 44 kDa isoform X3 n=1 Tax=Dipodomys merriami TaxID=94247 RepID=UPI00384E6AFD
MATGDLKRSLRNLEQVLRALNYPKEVDYVGLIKGDPAASLPIISYSLTSYSPYLTELLMESDVDLVGKNDICFTDTVYKTPSCQRKTMVCDKAEPSSSNENVAEAVGIDVTSRFITSGKKKALVIRHLYNEDNVDLPDDAGSSVTDVSEEFDSDCIKTTEIVIPEIQVCEVKTQQQDIKSIPEIAALETMLTQCHEKLQKLPCIEQRLDMLESAIKGKVMVDEKTWTNLLSRVTLLETEILLSKKNEFMDSNASEEYTSSSDAEVLPFDRKSNVEGTANVPHSSGYSSVSSTSRASAIRYCGLKDLSEETTIQKMERMKKMFEETAELLKISSR